MSFEKTATPHPDDTIVAISSAPGPGLRAIVRISGPNTRAVLNAMFTPTVAERSRYLTLGTVTLSGVHSPLPATLYYFCGPHSYTGQDLAELHTIGSPPLVEQLIADLLNAGARSAQPGEFTLRAFLAGKKNLPQAEAVHAIIEAHSQTELSAALDQLAGGLTRPLDALRDDLLNLLADLEAALDFADEDLEFVSRADTLARLHAAERQLHELLRQLSERTVAGRPLRIALVGLPNAGKSSLFNVLCRGEALVSPVPGTTRDYLVKPLLIQGVASEILDTAGWQDSTDTIEEQAQHLGREATRQADVILWCDEHGEFREADAARLAATGAEVLRVWTKCDTASNPDSHVGGLPLPASCSAVTGAGIEYLLAQLGDTALSLTRAALAPSQSRCRHHLMACCELLAEARAHVKQSDPPELAAATLRAALTPLGELTGTIYTNDLLDRIFSRFCIGK